MQQNERVTQAALQTERIRLVPLADEHFELELELHSDPEVMRYLTGDGRTREQVESAHRMRMATAEPVDGLGFWVRFVDGELVGWWLLEPVGWADGDLIEGQAELGYRFAAKALGPRPRGRRLAGGAAPRFRRPRPPSRVRPDHDGQRAVAGDDGAHRMWYPRTFHDDTDGPAGIEHGGVEYAITADEWRSPGLASDRWSA